MATETTTDTIRVSAIIPAPPERVYAAWLDSREHSAITRSTATVEPWVGGRHSAWGGSIRGTTLDLQPGRRIVQSWYASDFPAGSEDSRLEVLFEPVPDGTLITINHTGLPSGRGHRYEDGWKDYYLDHMRDYFVEHPDAPETVEMMPSTTPEPRPAPTTKKPPPRIAAKKPVARKAVAKKPAARKARAPKRGTAKAKAKAKPKARKKMAKKKPARAARKSAPGARRAKGRATKKRGR